MRELKGSCKIAGPFKRPEPVPRRLPGGLPGAVTQPVPPAHPSFVPVGLVRVGGDVREPLLGFAPRVPLVPLLELQQSQIV